MAKGDPVTTPYVYDSGGDSADRHLTCSFAFDNTTRALSGATVHRDAGCAYVAVLIGDPNGTPTRIPSSGTIPAGNTPVSKATLNKAGFTTIEDVLALQITATA